MILSCPLCHYLELEANYDSFNAAGALNPQVQLDRDPLVQRSTRDYNAGRATGVILCYINSDIRNIYGG